jgi:hypothetical protein
MRNWHNPDLFFLCNTKQNTQHLRGIIFFDFFMFFVQHCFICCPLDSPVSVDAGIEPRIVATLALPVRRSNHSACEAISSFLIFTLQMGEVGTEKALAAHQVLPLSVPTVPGSNRPGHFHQCHQMPGRNVQCFLSLCPWCRPSKKVFIVTLSL